MIAKHSGANGHRAPPDRGTLYLSSPVRRAALAVRNALAKAGLSVREVQPGLLATPFSARRADIWRTVFSGARAQIETEAIKCRLLAAGTSPSSADLMQAESLADFLAWLDGQWLADVVESGRLFSVFQPLVFTNRPERVYAYECLIRARSACGELIPPDRLFAAARTTGLLSTLDGAARRTAIESATSHGLNTPVFINIYPNAIQESARFVETTLAVAERTGLPPEHFVFEFVESEEIADPDGFVDILQQFRARGFRVALDDVGAGYSSLNVLVHVKPDFMKLDMGLIRNVDSDVYKSCVASKLLELAQELNVKTVVEGIETIGEWQWSQEHGADFAQGYLFARPDCPPPLPRFNGHQLTQTLVEGACTLQAADTASI
jgi:EAL domain-containing protein (putative c-di-GMP-specific phosphodiesterase class I)